MYRAPLPDSYVKACKSTHRNPITADYVMKLVALGHKGPFMVPATFYDHHLKPLPEAEAKRWLRTWRRRLARKQRAAA
jgi:hypothetical protein